MEMSSGTLRARCYSMSAATKERFKNTFHLKSVGYVMPQLILRFIMALTSSLESLRSIILSHSNDSILILTELLLLYITTYLTQFLLSIISPQFNRSPPDRQRQLAIILPIILTKLISISLILSTLYAKISSKSFEQIPFFRSIFGDSRSNTALTDELFDYWFLITIGYVFELLHRPSPPLLQGHHLVLQLFNYYYPFFLRHSSKNDLCSGILFILVIFGLGIQDTVVDIFALLYRILTAESKGATILVRGLGVLQECTRALEWLMLGWYLFTQWGEARRLLGPGELMFWGALLAGWVWTEVDDFVKLRAMTRKFGSKKAQKME